MKHVLSHSYMQTQTRTYVHTDNKTDDSLTGLPNFTSDAKPQPDVILQVKADGKVINDKAK